MDNKKGVIGIGVLLFLLIVVGGILYQVFFVKDRVADVDNSKTTESLKIEDSKDGFDFVAEYTKENTWEYTVKGQLPSPCHKASVETLILESYPEQVSVVLKIAKPEEDTACVQVIEEFEEKGQFTASEKAKVSFSVMK